VLKMGLSMVVVNQSDSHHRGGRYSDDLIHSVEVEHYSETVTGHPRTVRFEPLA